MPRRLPVLAGYLTFEAAAHEKRTTRQTIYNALDRGAFDLVHLGARRLIVANARWRAWQPDPAKQRGGRKSARERRTVR